jgi:large subunit ribosomal protein L12
MKRFLKRKLMRIKKIFKINRRKQLKMEYVYAALLLHKLGKPVDEESMKKVLESTGAEIDESKVKSLLASLKDVDIDAELEKAVVASAAAPAAAAPGEEAKPAEEAPKEEKKEESTAGLSALFG